MYLARREFGKQLRVYQLKTVDAPVGWFFDPWENPNGWRVNPAICEQGAAATGSTRSEAIANLQLLEDAT